MSRCSVWYSLPHFARRSLWHSQRQHCGGYDNSRPGDVYHPDFLLGRPAYFDITIRNSFQPSYVVHSAHCAGAAAGEIEKDDRHMANVEVAGGLFYPLVVESYGMWPPIACKYSKLLQDDLLFVAVFLLAELLLTCMDGSHSVFGNIMLEWFWTVCLCYVWTETLCSVVDW